MEARVHEQTSYLPQGKGSAASTVLVAFWRWGRTWFRRRVLQAWGFRSYYRRLDEIQAQEKREIYDSGCLRASTAIDEGERGIWVNLDLGYCLGSGCTGSYEAKHYGAAAPELP